MISKIYCIYDSKAEAYLPPFFMRSKGEVVRAVSGMVNDSQHNFCKHAEDFTLFEVGSFDDSTGFFDLYDAKQSIGCLLEFKKDIAPVV